MSHIFALCCTLFPSFKIFEEILLIECFKAGLPVFHCKMKKAPITFCRVLALLKERAVHNSSQCHVQTQAPCPLRVKQTHTLRLPGSCKGPVLWAGKWHGATQSSQRQLWTLVHTNSPLCKQCPLGAASVNAPLYSSDCAEVLWQHLPYVGACGF